MASFGSIAKKMQSSMSNAASSQGGAMAKAQQQPTQPSRVRRPTSGTIYPGPAPQTPFRARAKASMEGPMKSIASQVNKRGGLF